MKTGLVLVDIQNDYFPGGAMELVSMESVASTASTVLDTFREQKNPVYHIQHVSTRPGATFFIPGTEGMETHGSVAPMDGEPVIQKNFPNSFRETSLLEILRDEGIPHAEAPIAFEELRAADEIVLTGSLKEVMPAAELDGRSLCPDRSFPMARRLMARYREKVSAECGLQEDGRYRKEHSAP